nr:hypothetical protein JVH1_6102 [Rhodococcus sp. JVH1]
MCGDGADGPRVGVRLRTGSGDVVRGRVHRRGVPVPNVPGVPRLDLGPDFSCGTLTVPEDR